MATLTMGWAVAKQFDDGIGEEEVELELDYCAGLDPAVLHRRPEDCHDDGSYIEVYAAVRTDTGEDVWPGMSKEEQDALEDAAFDELIKGAA